jgi:carboxypeptidase Taq
VESDEFTYDLHIILRFELELKLLSGELEVKDLPGIWNEQFKTLMNLEVPDDARGCLQDIHWSMGGFGYFSTYTLGNLISAMLFEKAGQDVPSLSNDLGSGNYQPLLQWLRENVHRHGMRYRAPALVRKVTGQSLSVEPHIRYLRSKLDLMPA